MDWGALLGGFIGAGIPAILAYLGLSRGRQSADAEAFGPAVLLLYRVEPQRVTANVSRDASVEQEWWAEQKEQLEVARERLLVVSAGNPRRRVRELARSAEVKVHNAYHASHWLVLDMQKNRDIRQPLKDAQKAHAQAMAAMEALIDANFGWYVFGRPLRRLASAAGARIRLPHRKADAPKSLEQPSGQVGG
jgi:hypothetical protein